LKKVDGLYRDTADPPVIIYNGITKMRSDQYANFAPFNKGSDLAVSNCNQAISQMILNSFDYNVVFVDQSNYNPNTENLLCADLVHPNDNGHQKLANNINNNWPNIAPRATATASSEYSANYAASKAGDGIIGIQDTGEWASRGEQNPWIQLNWSSSQKIHKIVLYDRNNLVDAANGGTLSFSDGSTVPVTGLPNDGTGKIFSFPEKTVSWVRFQVSGGSGLNIGLSELQVFLATGGQCFFGSKAAGNSFSGNLELNLNPSIYSIIRHMRSRFHRDIQAPSGIGQSVVYRPQYCLTLDCYTQVSGIIYGKILVKSNRKTVNRFRHPNINLKIQ
jgi:hypothetical protein